MAHESWTPKNQNPWAQVLQAKEVLSSTEKLFRSFNKKDGDEDEQNRPPQGQDGYDDEAADQANADLFYNEHLFPVDDDDDRHSFGQPWTRAATLARD